MLFPIRCASVGVPVYVGGHSNNIRRLKGQRDFNVASMHAASVLVRLSQTFGLFLCYFFEISSQKYFAKVFV